MTAPAISGAPATMAGMASNVRAAGGNSAYAVAPQKRLLEVSESVGLIREMRPPSTFAGLQIAPMQAVASEDVTWQNVLGGNENIGFARAEDSEADLQMTDEIFGDENRARISEWASKHRYRASDVHRFRDYLNLAEIVRDQRALPLDAEDVLSSFRRRVIRDTESRKRNIDIRLEDVIMKSLSTGLYAVDTTNTQALNKIKYGIDWGRPADQTSQTPRSQSYASDTHDPIGDIQWVYELMLKRYGVRIERAITTRKVLNTFINSSKFLPRTGFLPGANVDPKYVMDGWGPTAAIEIVQRETGVTFEEYDAVWYSRARGSKTLVTNRFVPENRIIFLPNMEDVRAYNNTTIGFAKTLVAPAPENNWASDWFTWEREDIDPYGHDMGTGIKAFPVFPNMETTFTLDLTLPA